MKKIKRFRVGMKRLDRFRALWGVEELAAESSRCSGVGLVGL